MNRSAAISRALVRAANTILSCFGWQLVRQPHESDRAGRVAASFFSPSESCQIPNWGFLLQELLGEKTDGMFVEVGAFDGDSFSNTSCLADCGWGGLYIEPVPAFAQRCRDRHLGNSRIKVIEVAIGSDARQVTLFVGGPLTTSSPKLAEDYRALPWARDTFGPGEQFEARQFTLDQCLKMQGVQPGFDLLVVDVEGAEAEVFAGFDLERYRPTVMVVELADFHPDLPAFRKEHAALYRRLCDAGYRVVYKDSINSVFVVDFAAS